MKQKVEFQIQKTCSKCPRTALTIVAEAYGVESVALEGQQKDRVVVVGQGIDTFKLARRLKKKLGFTDLVSLSEVKSK